jgi:hypothetical protein
MKARPAIPIMISITMIMLAVSFVMPSNTIAKKETLYQAGYDHGCSDAKLTLLKRYINQPGKGPTFHTQEFMSGYNAGLGACSNKPSPIGSGSSILFTQGYAKGIADAKSLSRFPASTTMLPEDVDCDSDIDPKASNADYCSGYQHGFADMMRNNINNNALPITTSSIINGSSAAKSSLSSAQVAAPSPKVCPHGPAPGANDKCSPVSQATTDQGTRLSTTTTTPLEDHKGSNPGGSLSSSDNNNPAPPSTVNSNNNNNNNNNHENKPSTQHEGREGTTSTRPALTDDGKE